MLVSIFIPVFNGQQHLHQTLMSIKNQSYPNIEVLLLDDSSTDDSKLILEAFAKKDSRFKIFSKPNGGYVAAAWNFMMPKIKGDFVFYSSQDDLFSEDVIEKMVQKQQQTQADSVLPDMEFYYQNKENNPKTIGYKNNRDVVLSGKQACQASLNWHIHGFALTKTSLIKEEYFFEDAFDTDEFITRKLFLKSNKVVFSEGTFFYRQDNTNAITKTFGVKNFYTLNTLYRIAKLLKENNFDEKIVFEAQSKLLNGYFDAQNKSKVYSFENELAKKEVLLFLNDFKNKKLILLFNFDTFKHALQNVQCRFLMKWLVVGFYNFGNTKK